MSNTWGNKLKLSIFGESHGAGIGIVLHGIEPGITLDMGFIEKEMKRRAPGQDALSTSRKEADRPEILSGVFQGVTTGAPIAMMIRNQDTRSKDYSETKNLMRPGHADYPAYEKYKGYNDYRGGGMFSGRITAPLVFVGAIAKQILSTKGIQIGAHIQQIGQVKEEAFDPVYINPMVLNQLKEKEMPVMAEEKIAEMKEEILVAKRLGDSVGGLIECAILGLEAGIGEPFFHSVESTIASLAFSIPAVKGIEFGAGFDFANKRGSQSNDAYYVEQGRVKTYTNHNGGITGGITNHMPVLFKVVMKATPSISKQQKTIHIQTKTEELLEIKGRHDPCIVPRAVVIIEAIAAISVLELI